MENDITLNEHPDRNELSKYYVFSGQTADAIAHANAAIDGILTTARENWNVHGLSHYRQAQFFSPSVQYADDALALLALPAELRMRLRRALAVGAYQIADPDVNPCGSGIHLPGMSWRMSRP